ncbi:MAG TPA: hypothetical protein PK954_04200 [Anaerolineales bacterium]|nr:hypothetical protein [Anaerolineales bacterium]HRF46649.1 hypothetical protein [Anaerolineales bacterium]
MDTTISVNASDLAALIHKVDTLTDTVKELSERVETQRRSAEAVEELVQDLSPIANQAFRSAIRELDDIDDAFSSEDLIHLVKQLLANTRRFNALLIQLESALDLVDELQVLTRPVFHSAVHALDQLEHKGYFAFGREGVRIAERVVTEFSEDDVRALGDNIVTILRTVKNMTQPDIMALANRAADSLHETEAVDPNVSVWSLVRDMNDPKVRQGLARLMRVLRTFSEGPGNQASSN